MRMTINKPFRMAWMLLLTCMCALPLWGQSEEGLVLQESQGGLECRFPDGVRVKVGDAVTLHRGGTPVAEGTVIQVVERLHAYSAIVKLTRVAETPRLGDSVTILKRRARSAATSAPARKPQAEVVLEGSVTVTDVTGEKVPMEHVVIHLIEVGSGGAPAMGDAITDGGGKFSFPIRHPDRTYYVVLASHYRYMVWLNVVDASTQIPRREPMVRDVDLSWHQHLGFGSNPSGRFVLNLGTDNADKKFNDVVTPAKSAPVYPQCSDAVLKRP